MNRESKSRVLEIAREFARLLIEDGEAVVCPVCHGAGKDRWGICGECKGVGAKQKGDEG